jgi:hypothetical protein
MNADYKYKLAVCDVADKRALELHNTLLTEALIGGHVAMQVLAIRRLVDNRGDDVISLRKLLKDIRRGSAAKGHGESCRKRFLLGLPRLRMYLNSCELSAAHFHHKLLILLYNYSFDESFCFTETQRQGIVILR